MRQPMVSLRKALVLEGGGVVSLVGAGGKTTLMYRIARELACAGETVLTTTTTKILSPDPKQSPHVIRAATARGVLDRAPELLRTRGHVTAAADGLSSGKLTGFEPGIVDALARSGAFRWIIVEADGAARMPLKAPADHEPVVPGSTGWLVAVAGLDAVGKPARNPFVFRPELFCGVTGTLPGRAVTEAAVAAIMTDPGQGMMKGCPADARRLVFLNKADTADRVRVGRAIADRVARMRPNPPIRVVVGTALGDEPVALVRDPDP